MQSHEAGSLQQCLLPCPQVWVTGPGGCLGPHTVTCSPESLPCRGDWDLPFKDLIFLLETPDPVCLELLPPSYGYFHLQSYQKAGHTSRPLSFLPIPPCLHSNDSPTDALKRHWLCPWTHHSFHSSLSFLIYKIRTGVRLSSHRKDQMNEVTPEDVPPPGNRPITHMSCRGTRGPGCPQPPLCLHAAVRLLPEPTPRSGAGLGKEQSSQQQGRTIIRESAPLTRTGVTGKPTCTAQGSPWPAALRVSGGTRVIPLELHPARAPGSPVDRL